VKKQSPAENLDKIVVIFISQKRFCPHAIRIFKGLKLRILCGTTLYILNLNARQVLTLYSPGHQEREKEREREVWP
jgi:hypothetical protein